jgi:membrane-associated phospholipid phosphatase
MRRFAVVLMLSCVLAAPAARAEVDSFQESAADGLTALIPLGSLYLTYQFDDKDGRKQLLWCVGSSEVVISLLRLGFNQTSLGERPNGNEYGFPSGHIAFIGSASSFLQHRYGWQYGVPAWAATAYVSYVRMETEHHYLRDVLWAAGIVEGIAWLTVTDRDDGPLVEPLIGSGFVGVRVASTFGGD